MDRELKACPFCGSTDVVLRSGISFNGAVHCNNCTADVVFEAVNLLLDGRDWKDVVSNGWNKRAKESDSSTKHGKWIIDGLNYSECSVCHRYLKIDEATAELNYCLNCGAKMDLEG